MELYNVWGNCVSNKLSPESDKSGEVSFVLEVESKTSLKIKIGFPL